MDYVRACYSFDTNKDKFIDFEELKRMMEKVGSPQTHLALKAMIREVDEDGDNRISFREVGHCICNAAFTPDTCIPDSADTSW